MQKVKDSDLTLYEEIEEIKKRRARQKEQGVSCPSCVSCKALTLCNNSDNYKTPYKTDTSQGRLVPVPIIVQDPTPKQDPCSVAVPEDPAPINNPGLLPELPPMPEPEVKQSIPACYCCHERKWWISVYGVKVCGTCYPPASEKLVREWLENNESAPGDAVNIQPGALNENRTHILQGKK